MFWEPSDRQLQRKPTRYMTIFRSSAALAVFFLSYRHPHHVRLRSCCYRYQENGQLANLYAVAVVNNDEREEALLVSKNEGLEINEDSNNQWASDDLDWTTTEWFVKEEQQEDFENGTFYVDNEEEDFRLYYHVTYPFHSEQDLTYEELLVRLNGNGWIGENLDEYHEFYVTVSNPSVGESSETYHSFYPYVVSEMFSLPPARYKIKPEGEFTVVWE